MLAKRNVEAIESDLNNNLGSFDGHVFSISIVPFMRSTSYGFNEMQSDGESCRGQHELHKVQKLSSKSSQINLSSKTI